MLDFLTPLLKLFNNEPVERLMYIIIIFGLILWVIPKEFAVSFNAHTGIPWFFQIILFAFSFVVAVSFSRLRSRIQKYFSLLPEQRVLLRLSGAELALLKDFLKNGNIVVSSFSGDPVMKKMERKGIIEHQINSAGSSYYLITERYAHFMKLLWNSKSRRFNHYFHDL
ncbi:super-infection exclusion protein B [Citrobacter sedlakii]|nr:super-infection exclusion protein B [Citrobacter sedlakii]MDR5007303.1 super-infection exclusion protein B [Citrobacter sedlakii]